MKKSFRIAAIVAAVLLAVIIVAPMALRGKVAEIVKREANAMLTAKLDFEKLNISLLRHFPHASVELKGLTLVGTERFEGDTIVAARRISVVVDLLSFFGDEGFEVSKVILAAPALHAHKLADGAVNWDDVTAMNAHLSGQTVLTGNSLRSADTNNDGVVNYSDLTVLINYASGTLGHF